MKSADQPSPPSKPSAAAAGGKLPRRDFLTRVGQGVVAASLAAPALLSIRSLVPNTLYESPRRLKVGPAEQFAEGPTFLPEQKVYVFRAQRVFHCLSATCTHLGCTVQLVRLGTGTAPESFEFHCPCHGSKFHGDGTNYDGPAPRPLDYHALALAPDDGQLVVDLGEVADKGWRLTVS